MKILQVIQKSQLRGAEIFATQLGEHLNALGQECKIVALFKGDHDLSFAGDMINLNRPLTKRLWDWAGWRSFAEIVAKEKPSIVQANAGDTLKFAVLSKLFFKWKTPIVFRNASTISSYIKSPWVLWLNRFLFSKVAFVVSVSHFTLKDFLKVFPFMKDKIIAIPIGIAIAESSEARNESDYLLHVGGFTFEKNHEGLLRIIRRVVQLDPTQQLWLVGDGPLRPHVERQVKEMGLQSNVRFLGYQKAVLPYMKSARALLLPSIIEGLPGVILEAMYCRTPVVAYDVGGISEVVRNGQTGWLVKAGDEQAFVTAIEEVLHSRHLATITDNAYNLVVHDYDNRVIAKRFLEVYEKIIKQ